MTVQIFEINFWQQKRMRPEKRKMSHLCHVADINILQAWLDFFPALRFERCYFLHYFKVGEKSKSFLQQARFDLSAVFFSISEKKKITCHDEISCSATVGLLLLCSEAATSQRVASSLSANQRQTGDPAADSSVSLAAETQINQRDEGRAPLHTEKLNGGEGACEGREGSSLK